MIIKAIKQVANINEKERERERERDQGVKQTLVQLIIEEKGCEIDSGNEVERFKNFLFLIRQSERGEDKIGWVCFCVCVCVCVCVCEYM